MSETTYVRGLRVFTRLAERMGGVGYVPVVIIFSLILMFFGAIVTVVPWFFVVGFCFFVVFSFVVVLFPSVGVFSYLVLILVAPDFKISDVATVYVLGLVLARVLATRVSFSLIPLAIFRPYFLLLIVVFVSLVLAVFYFHNSKQFIYRDGRSFVYLAWLPLLFWLKSSGLVTLGSLRRVVFYFAVIVAFLSLFQAATGHQVIAMGRVGDLESTGYSSGEVLRVQIPGLVFVAMCLVWSMAGAVTKSFNYFSALFFCFIFSLALYFNFGRAVWVWTALSVFICIFLMDFNRSIKLCFVVLFGGCVLVGGGVVFKPAAFDAAVERITSVQREGGWGTSYGWRQLENKDAVSNIIKSPFFGVGLGGEYRRWIYEIRNFEDHTRYVHNSYLFYALKMGVVGVFVLLWYVFSLWRSAFNRRRLGFCEKFGSFELAVAAYLPAAVALNITQPEFTTPIGVMFLILISAAIDWGRSVEESHSKSVVKDLEWSA